MKEKNEASNSTDDNLENHFYISNVIHTFLNARCFFDKN